MTDASILSVRLLSARRLEGTYDHAWNALWRATLIKYNVSLSVSQDSAEVRVESTDPTVNELNWTPRAECDLLA